MERPSRDDLVDAVMEPSSERGFAELSLQAVVERAGTDRRAFHRHFDDLEDAFAEGYRRVSDSLCADLLGAGRSGADWPAGFDAALGTFLGWVAARPGLARVLLVEYRAAGESTLALHERAFERLAGAMDCARAELAPDLRPPKMAASFLLGGIEAASADLVLSGRPASAPDLAADLNHLAVLIYCGEES